MGGFTSKRARAQPPPPPPPPPPRTPPPPPLTEAETAQLALKRTRVQIRKFEARLEQECAALLGRAREALAGDGGKEAALRLMRLKKLKTRQLETIGGQLLTLEQFVLTIQSEEQTASFMAALTAGNATLKRMQEELPLDTVTAILSESADRIAAQREVDAAIMGALADGDAVDEDALMGELDALGGAAETAAAPAPTATPAAARAPAAAAAAPAEDDGVESASAARSLAQLAAEFPVPPTGRPTVPSSSSSPAPAPAPAAAPRQRVAVPA